MMITGVDIPEEVIPEPRLLRSPSLEALRPAITASYYILHILTTIYSETISSAVPIDSYSPFPNTMLLSHSPQLFVLFILLLYMES